MKSKSIILQVSIIILSLCNQTGYAQSIIKDKDNRFDWIQTARVFLIDAYQPPFAPELEYDAHAIAKTMVDMNANVLRFGTMGKYATIQGVRFSAHPDQGNRDLLRETIKACKPKGIKVVPYISTGHKLAWSMVTKDYPEYAQQSTPDGKPLRSHMYVGEDHGTVCWMTPYRQAYLDYVEHVVRDYDIDGIYFDAWFPNYFWQGRKLCYCHGCINGFKKATGLEIPYHENENEYTKEDERTIEKYHQWYFEEYITNVVMPVRKLVKSHKDIPLISNINNPEKMAALDVRILNAMDAFLYERGKTILERAEGVSVPRSLGLHIWPYIGVYHNWPRLAFHGINYQQQIFTNLMFGGGSVIAQPTGYVTEPEYRKYVRYPFGIIEHNENKLKGLENYPYIGVVFAYDSPEAHVKKSWNEGTTNARTSALGAFSACLYGHVQVSSISEFVLDKPNLLKKYSVLYLANIPCLSDKRIKNIRQYVKDGGCLVASYETSLYNDEGNCQRQFALEDLFKVRPLHPSGELENTINSYTTMLGGPNDLYLQTTPTGMKYFQEEWNKKLFPLWYYTPVEVLEGGEVLMDIVRGYDQKTILPAVIKAGFGKGKVIYCTSALESLYHSGGQNILHELILKFVRAVTGNPVPYKLEAPASLLGNLTISENRMIFHMTNWTGNKFEHPWRNEYYLAPVEDVDVILHIPKGKSIKNITTLVEANFTKEIEGQKLKLSFPEIGAYQAVVIDLK